MNGLSAEELIVSSKADCYKQNSIKEVKCFKQVSDGSVIIPCRFNMYERKYEHIDFNLAEIELREEQVKIMAKIRSLIKTEDELHISLHGKRKPCIPIFINASTGIGKTLLSLAFAAKVKGPVLIITSSTGVTESWFTETERLLGITPVIASGNSLGKHQVCILSKQLASRNTDKFSDDDYSYYKTVICDEADTLCTQKAVNFMLRFKPRYLLGLSATIDRKDGLDKILDVFWGLRSNWIYHIQNFNDEKKVTINFIHTGVQIPELKTRSGQVDWIGIARESSSSPVRDEIIRGLTLIHMTDKLLISTTTTDYADSILHMLKGLGIDVNKYYKNDKRYIDASVMITTVSKGGRGNDDKNLAEYYDGRRFNVMIMTLTKCDPEQLIGRLRAENCVIYILVDDNSTMKSHMRKIETKYSARLAKINHIYYPKV